MFFFSSRRRHTRWPRDWSSDVCSSDLKTIHEINDKAFQGTVLAHNDGGVPNLILELPKLDAYTFGYLVYFFEKACALSGYLLGVNPFDQPGVEEYKTNMFALLGKAGFEAEKEALEKRL